MKIKKYIFIASVLTFSFISAQSTDPENKRVGINTENPLRTLDVNGTISVSDLPLKEEGVIPLGLASNDQQVMKAFESDGVGKPFRIVNFKIKLNTPSQDWINAIDLKIPTDKYTLFLMSSSLVDTSDVDSRGNFSSVFLNLLGIDELYSKNHDPELYFGQYASRGVVEVIKKSINYSDSYTGKVAVGAKQVYLYPYTTTKTWKLYADYPASKGVNYKYEEGTNRDKVVHPDGRYADVSALKDDSNYTWLISVLIVDNNWIAKKDVSLDIEDDSDYLPKNSVTVLP